MTPTDLLTARKRLNLTQHALAVLIGETAPSISLMETGKRKITRKTAMLIKYMLKHGVLKDE